MAEIVNLRHARKQRARAGKEAEAEENRVRFGTPKALRAETERLKAKEKAAHETRRLDEKDQT